MCTYVYIGVIVYTCAGRKKGGLSRTTESGKERADDDTGAVLIEPDDKMLKEAKKNLGRK